MGLKSAISYIHFTFPLEREYGGVLYSLVTFVEVKDDFPLITIAYMDEDMCVTTVGIVGLDEDFEENVKNLLDIFDYKL